MARLTQAPITPSRNVSNQDSLTDLSRLLDRLQANILHADAERERRLRASEYERKRVEINLEYARTLLTKLEQDALGVKVHARRQEIQADLNRKRDVLEQVAERLGELEEISVDSDEDSSEGEDLIGDIDTPSESVESASASASAAAPTADQQGADGSTGDAVEEEQDDEAEDVYESAILPKPQRSDTSHPPAAAASTTTRPPSETRTAEVPTTTTEPPKPQQTTGTTTSQTLRPRAGAPQQAATDTAETSALRTQLFGSSRTTDPTAAAAAATATAEAIMDHHRAEQDQLTASMVAMARALKESTHKFSSALREDQDVLQAAGRGLERNERGLGAVAGRMGALRRLAEGKGWWGRVLLYAWIAGLALFAVLLVFVFPKLRF
ncbi:hypothetical protein AAE478_003677 [Parahypoxylon ruwenzoriense]